MPAPIPHHQAAGIHRGAFVQDSAPDTSDVQDGVLWLDTSAGPPYTLKRWDAGGALWRTVQMDSTGYPLPQGHRLEGYTRAGLLSVETSLIGLVGNLNATNETIVPGMDLTLDSFDGPLSVNISVSFHDQVPQDTPWHLVARLRRDALDGPALATQTWTTPDSQTLELFVGLVNNYQWILNYVDSSPTTGHYIITVQKLEQETIPLTTEHRFLRVREATDPGSRVRIVHQSAGPVLDMPFEQAAAPPNIFLGRDTISGLPKWSSLPMAANGTAVPAVSTASDTCIQMRCGVAVQIRDKIIEDYHFWRHIINAVAATFLGLTIAAFIEEMVALMVAMEVAAWVLTVFRVVSPVIKLAAPLALPSLVPDVTPDQSDYILQTLFCALGCDGDIVGVNTAVKQGVANTLLADTSVWASDIQRMLIGEVAYYYPLTDWQAAATNAVPNVLCDGMSCG